MVGMPNPTPMPFSSIMEVQRKRLSYKMYKERSNTEAYVRSFEKCIWRNGEMNEVVINFSR